MVQAICYVNVITDVLAVGLLARGARAAKAAEAVEGEKGVAPALRIFASEGRAAAAERAGVLNPGASGKLFATDAR